MIEITTLGNFCIKVNGNIVSESFRRTTKLLQLLNMLIINKNRPVPASSICDVIWGEDQNGDTYKALHNLVYRLRHILMDGNGADCIIFNNKTYMLNTAIDMRIDIYTMEDCYNKAINAQLPTEEKITLLEKAVDLYNGEYLLYLICDDTQSYAVINRYKRIYIDSVCLLSDLYMENGFYDKMFLICDKAIALEPLEEAVYMRMVRGMCDKGKDAQAISLIENYFNILYNEVGIRASDTLNNIYKKLKRNNNPSTYDVGQILEELKEISSLNKALFCNFEAFRDIYRYESRQSARRDYTIVLILIEIYGDRNAEVPEKILSAAKKSLYECCMLTLRKGDMFAEYSKAQVILMITVSTESAANLVVSRLSEQFFLRNQRERLHLKFDIQSP
ncbi:MAG: winged helix-turn-helix domain-containing protein [Firmicutes bacterium]|nr:winged helix-turn-helix domain-containing protein [Bacillota bacterium]